MVARQSIHLIRPHAEVTQAAVNEQNGHTAPFFHVSEVNAVCVNVFDPLAKYRARNKKQYADKYALEVHLLSLSLTIFLGLFFNTQDRITVFIRGSTSKMLP